MTIAKVAGGSLEHAQQPLEDPEVALVRHAFQAATGEHGEQLRLGEGEAELGVTRPGFG